MFYRKDVFEEKGWTAPTTIEELMALAEQAKSAGMVPVSMGTKEMWPAAGWFDHMALRIRGLEKHLTLMDGKLADTDASLKPVFDRWEDRRYTTVRARRCGFDRLRRRRRLSLCLRWENTVRNQTRHQDLTRNPNQ